MKKLDMEKINNYCLSENHMVKTNKGWIKIKNLTKDMQIYVMSLDKLKLSERKLKIEKLKNIIK